WVSKITKYHSRLSCIVSFIKILPLPLLVEERTSETKWPEAIQDVKNRILCEGQSYPGINSFNFCHQTAFKDVFATWE
ncbi:MAG: hypothetical protein R3351_03175, partial [Nitrospirales bacterium]|nr:hypothetical protein [Nitrospirales bacterium]